MSKSRLFAARIARDKSGAAAVEFAIVSVALLALIFGISYLGIMLYNSPTLNWAMEKGAADPATKLAGRRVTTLLGLYGNRCEAAQAGAILWNRPSTKGWALFVTQQIST